MRDDDSQRKLQENTEYLQQLIGHFLTHQEYQKKHFQAQSQSQEQQIRSLTQSAQAVTGSTSRLISEAAKGIQDETRDAIARGAAEELATMRERADAAAAKLLSAVEAFAQQKTLLDKERKKFALTWMGGIVIVAVLAMLGVGTYVASKKHEYDDLQVKADYLSAYNAADVVLSGNQLWVDIDLKSKRTINGKAYYLAQPR
jgi:hypothetical protein